MGRRGAAETLVAIVDAFHARRTWRQDELAAHLEITVRTLRTALSELQRARFPLERSEEGRHVYWSLPRTWVAGGVAVADADVPALVRLVARAPRSRAQQRLLARLLAAAPPRTPVAPADAVLAPSRSDGQEAVLETLERALAERCAVLLGYASTTSGAGERHVSPQRLAPEAPVRFVAHCHKAGELRWFRLDRVRRAQLDRRARFVEPPAGAVDAFVGRSIDGFHGAAPPTRSVFVVRDPEARWAEGNLLAPMRAERTAEGLVVTVETTGIERVARFVVGLGAAARVETAELRAAVRALAEGALARCGEGRDLTA